MLKSDKWITKMSLDHRMIEPFCGSLINRSDNKKIISYGLSSYGYDIRLGDKYKVFTNVNNALVDPKNFDENSFVYKQGQSCIIPPNSFILGHSVEKIKTPRNVMILCIGKSSYARCGLILNVTPMEPEWEGHITLEISNSTPLPAIVYANEGISQLLFLEGDEQCAITYADRNGKYQNQPAEVVLPRL